MTVCTDVYVRPQTCDTISIYPSQVHPFAPDSGGGGSKHFVQTYPVKKKRRHDTDEEVWAYLHLP